VHTGQHYDFNMSDAFFRDLGLPASHFSLGVGSGSHAEQTGGVMIAYEKICLENRPDAIVVAGDVNSTAACAIVGTKLWIPVIHLEAGLRSGDRRMPEEINRLVTDAITDLLWTPSVDADDNLKAEGVPDRKICLIGNIMIDSFELLRAKIEASPSRKNLGLDGQDYGLVTLHRPSNVDNPTVLREIVEALARVAKSTHLAFVVHPRTLKTLKEFALYDGLLEHRDITLFEPLPYIDFMGLATQSAFIITDSGGLQEESTYLRIPCLTLRENTERPITVTLGTNRLLSPKDLFSAIEDIRNSKWPAGSCPPLWDGKAAYRAVDSLAKLLSIQ
jgi:UDP-N-acetylglucosamine 2-epimerase (non-hydrolysing)